MAFSAIFDFIFKMYDLLMTTGLMLFQWFGDEVSEEILTLFELPLGTTNLDLILGVFVPVMLVLALFGFIFNSIKPT